jgi:hypothetical protein
MYLIDPSQKWGPALLAGKRPNPQMQGPRISLGGENTHDWLFPRRGSHVSLRGKYAYGKGNETLHLKD